jgi:hypothetical protein
MSRSKYLLLYRFSDWHEDNDVLVPINIRLVNKSYSIEMNKWYANIGNMVYSYMGTRFHGTSGELYDKCCNYRVYDRGNYIVKYDNDTDWLYKVKDLRIKMKFDYELKCATFSYKSENRYFYRICLNKENTWKDVYPYFPPQYKDIIIKEFGDPFAMTVWMLKQIELGVI